MPNERLIPIYPVNNYPSAVIETLSHDGRGIFHIQGKITFIQGALPGEEVTYKLIKQKSTYNEAQALEILKSSSARVEPLCKHFGICGGCSQQYIHANAQVIYKQNILQELLSRHAKIEPQSWLAPIISPPWGYRRKARLGVKYIRKKVGISEGNTASRDGGSQGGESRFSPFTPSLGFPEAKDTKKEKLIIGFREKQGRLITDCQQCEVLHPSIGKKLLDFSALLTNLSIREHIPQLEIAVGEQNSAVIIRHLKPFSSNDLETITAFANQTHLQIYLQPAGLDSIHPLCPQSFKPLYYTLDRYHLTLEFCPQHFIQVNTFVNEKMIDLALDLLEIQPNDQVLDLFCGIGNFSLPMARLQARVTGVEGDDSAVQQAMHNAKINHIEEIEFYKDDLFSESWSAPWATKTYHKMLLDPPRAGAAAIVNNIQRWQPEKIVYVSCDLATLTRDAKILHQQGYQMLKAGVMDMFPHTQHVEAIILFNRS